MLIDRADFADLDTLAAHRHYAAGSGSSNPSRCEVAIASPDLGGAAPPRAARRAGELPLIDKEMLRDSQRAHPPFGDYLAAPAHRVARVHRTSGTSGTAMNLALSARDAHETAIVGARAQAAGGLGPGHRVAHCLNYRLWMGGLPTT